MGKRLSAVQRQARRWLKTLDMDLRNVKKEICKIFSEEKKPS
jgi:hypothetical protein